MVIARGLFLSVDPSPNARFKSPWQGPWVQQRGTLHQDNTSPIRLGEGGKAPSTKRTRHIDIRYFFVTDRLKASGSRLDIQHCPTGGVSAGLLAKPLQGSLPRGHRDTIIGVSASEFDNYRNSYNAARNARGTPASE